jgi:hypothetical protein
LETPHLSTVAPFPRPGAEEDDCQQDAGRQARSPATKQGEPRQRQSGRHAPDDRGDSERRDQIKAGGERAQNAAQRACRVYVAVGPAGPQATIQRQLRDHRTDEAKSGGRQAEDKCHMNENSKRPALEVVERFLMPDAVVQRRDQQARQRDEQEQQRQGASRQETIRQASAEKVPQRDTAKDDPMTEVQV